MADDHDFQFLMFLKQLAAIVLFGGLAMLIAAEAILPREGSRWSPARLRHGFNNLALWGVGILVISFVFGGTVWLMLQWFQFRRIGLLYFVSLPTWLHAILAFLALDACDYFFHRLSHNVRWLWLLHAVHHSDNEVDVTTNLRQHPLHIVPTELWNLVACAAIGVPAWVFLIHEVVSIGFAHLHHAAVAWPRWIDRVFSWLLITPRMHWTHHSPQQPNTDSNYGVVLSIWDRWFGTINPPAHDPQFGLSRLTDKRWHSAWGMLLTPWRARSLDRL